MSKKKYYAVKRGRQPGIYATWEECKAQVDGFRDNVYGKFDTYEEAHAYVYGNQPANAASPDSDQAAPMGRHFDISTDGAYDPLTKRYGWAFVVYCGDRKIYEENGAGKDSGAAESRNVAGELEAVKRAIPWALAHGADSVTIHYDYIGVEEWALGGWRANKKLTQDYVRFIRPHLGRVRFNKVRGHSGVPGNELADKLAKEALRHGR